MGKPVNNPMINHFAPCVQTTKAQSRTSSNNIIEFSYQPQDAFKYCLYWSVAHLMKETGYKKSQINDYPVVFKMTLVRKLMFLQKLYLSVYPANLYFSQLRSQCARTREMFAVTGECILSCDE
ncbi:hypothetical protein JTE90_018045 [Oedothorax gibbosus]|uniref:Uncharacterized protein n=1 Tax=Oedothorax gibbosus TaxID=931172 RepID=A0AAV6TID5_9ARAC|nr:hypothetical protein JTE90_018045 [Oedothorax gibbosus]